MARVATPYIFVDPRSELNAAHLNGQVGGIIKARTPPTVLTPPGISPQMIDYAERLERRAYEVSGVSQLSAQSRKPAGIDSGVALREMQDIETLRFEVVAQRYQRYFVKLAAAVVDESRRLYESDPSLAVTAVGDEVRQVRWKEVDLARDQYVLRPYPVSQLPRDPSGRLQTVSEYIDRGFIQDREVAMALLNVPDIKDAFSLETASYDAVRSMLTDIAKGRGYRPPTDDLNLPQAVKMSTAMLLRATRLGLEDHRLSLLSQWRDEAKALLVDSQRASAGQAAPNPQEVAA
jgi:hypothetical protein